MFLRAAALLAATLSTTIAAAVQDSSSKAQPASEKTAEKRIGDAYPLETCPVSAKKLAADAKPSSKLYDGREVRFCCMGCVRGFEKDQAASFAQLDDKITKDQLPLYPLKTSLISGKSLPAKPVQFVYGNRLVLLASDGEKVEFLKDPAKHLAALDKAVIQKQTKDYPLKKCLVSAENLPADATDVVIAGRLVRICCAGCKSDLDVAPAKYIAAVDKARKTDSPK